MSAIFDSKALVCDVKTSNEILSHDLVGSKRRLFVVPICAPIRHLQQILFGERVVGNMLDCRHNSGVWFGLGHDIFQAL
jgi:hypothetical protein